MTRLILILALIASFSWACNDAPAPVTKENVKAKPVSDKIITTYEALDIKPRFGGCDEIKDEAELKSCTDKKMAEFISTNLQYPEGARTRKIEGKAVVSFVIEPNGSLSEITAITNLGGGLEEEAIRVFNLMNKKKMWWKPGWKDGKRQRVKLQLPINFKL